MRYKLYQKLKLLSGVQTSVLTHTGTLFLAVFRIRIGFGFNLASGSESGFEIRIQEGKIDTQK